MDTEALRRAALEQPDDTSLRLVLADALIQAGDPQGPFIAHQCALAGMDPLDPERTPLKAATRRLQAEHAETWLAPLLAGLDSAEFRRRPVSRLRNAVFSRGFLTRIALRQEDLPLLDTLAQHTHLEGIELLVGEHIADDAPRADTSGWSHLQITPDDWFTAHSVARVLCWGTASLRALDLSGCDLGDDGARLIVGEPTDLGEHFEDHVDPEPIPAGQLERLVLKNTNLRDTGLQILLDSGEALSNLRALVVSQCRLTDGESLTRLREAPAGQHLEELSLAGNNALEIAALAGWERMRELARLGLPRSTTPEQLTSLIEGSPVLRRLDLAGAKGLLATPEVVFAAAQHFTHLNLSTAGLKDAGFARLVASPSTHSLDVLQVNGCSLSDKAVQALVESDLVHLLELDISSNKLSDASLARLAAWPGIANLTHLRIRNNRKLGPDGYAALIDCEAFQPVRFDVGKVKAEPTLERLRARFGSALVDG